VLGSGDCIEPSDIVERLRCGVGGVLVGRGVLRNPWILAQAADLASGRIARQVTLGERGQFLLDYIDLLLGEGLN
jgi:tRNA-dihydrouridine synthase